MDNGYWVLEWGGIWRRTYTLCFTINSRAEQRRSTQMISGGVGKRKGIEFFGWTGAVISLGTHTQARTHTHAERRTHTHTHLQAFL